MSPILIVLLLWLLVGAMRRVSRAHRRVFQTRLGVSDGQLWCEPAEEPGGCYRWPVDEVWRLRNPGEVLVSFWLARPLPPPTSGAVADTLPGPGGDSSPDPHPQIRDGQTNNSNARIGKLRSSARPGPRRMLDPRKRSMIQRWLISPAMRMRDGSKSLPTRPFQNGISPEPHWRTPTSWSASGLHRRRRRPPPLNLAARSRGMRESSNCWCSNRRLNSLAVGSPIRKCGTIEITAPVAAKSVFAGVCSVVLSTA